MTALRPVSRDLRRPDHIHSGAAPMLQWIPIDRLRIDDGYQRGLDKHNWRTIGLIASAFSWSKFSTVLVSPIEGGLFAVIDGQHRTHAAAACGIEEVPCQVTLMTREEQAAAFAAINGTVTRVTPWQIFKAAIAAGEPWAMEIAAVAEAAGCRAMLHNTTSADRRAGEIYGVAYLRTIVARRGGHAVTSALSVLRGARPLGERPDVWSYGTMRPIVKALMGRSHVLERPEMARAFLGSFDVDEAAAGADRFIAERRRAGEPVATRIELLEARIGEALDAAFPPPTDPVPPITVPAPALAPLARTPEAVGPEPQKGEEDEPEDLAAAIADGPAEIGCDTRSLFEPEPDRAERHAVHPLFHDRRATQCVWPLWGEGTPVLERRCCGSPISPNQKVPYCAEHQAVSVGPGSRAEVRAHRELTAIVTKERAVAPRRQGRGA